MMTEFLVAALVTGLGAALSACIAVAGHRRAAQRRELQGWTDRVGAWLDAEPPPPPEPPSAVRDDLAEAARVATYEPYPVPSDEDRADAEADTIAALRAIERGDLRSAVAIVDRTHSPRQLAAHLTGVTAAAIDALSCLGYRVDTTRWAARAALRDLEELP